MNNVEFVLKLENKVSLKSPIDKEDRGKTHLWYNCDNEELYKENLIKNRKLMEENDWVGTRIEYTLNKSGYRCKEFDIQSNNIMFLGCSFTFGLGLKEEQRWSTIVSNKLKLREVNFGFPGGSNDYCFRMLVKWFNIIKPKLVVMLSPPNRRYEYIDYIGPSKHGSEHRGEIITNFNINEAVKKNMSYFHDMFMYEPTNSILNYAKNVMAIEHFLQHHNVKFIWDHFYETYESFGRKHKTDFARDISHYGVKTNIDTANHVLDQIG